MKKLKIAIQKSGRLSEKSLQLLTETGIHVANGNRKLVSASSDFPIELLFLRDDDIPEYVADKVAHAGIVGQNVIAEKGQKLVSVLPLGFARCRMSLAVSKEVDYPELTWFSGKRIATTYPAILKEYLESQGIQAEIHVISGSVEIAPGIGLADGIFDIVSTGSTLISNGLKEVEKVMDSEAVLVRSPDLEPGQLKILDELVFRFKAVLNARNNKYILLNAPSDKLKDIVKIIPGMKSPTIMPLAEEGWSSVHSVLSEEQFWKIIDDLKALGAQGILVIPIEKMIL